MNNIVPFVKKNPLLFFFLFSFIISWILWIPLLYGHFKLGWTSWEGDSWTNYKTHLGLLGSLGPAISAIIMTGFIEGKTSTKALLKRAVQWRVNILWWAISLYSWWLICTLLAIVLDLKSIQDITLGFVFSLINIPAMIFVLQMPLLIGMFGEELGWRGFALPKLLEKFDPLVASLILALPWILWHAPLLVFQEWRGEMPLLNFLIQYVVLIVPLTLIFTWFFQKTKGSVLLAIILHKSFNLTFNAYSIAIGLDHENSQTLRTGATIILWVVAMMLTIYYINKLKQNKQKQISDCKLIGI